MKAISMLLVLSILPLTSFAHADDSFRSQLLEGVRHIAAPGCIPGDLAVFGKRAFAVITGRMGNARLPMVAGANYGIGRAIAAGHEGFFGGNALHMADNATLTSNILAWAGKKPLKGLRVAIMNQDAALASFIGKAGCRVATINGSDIPARLKEFDVLWLGQASLDNSLSKADDINRWVRLGGGLVVTGPAWGWQSLNPQKDLIKDHTGNRLLLSMGIAFAGSMLEPDRNDQYNASSYESLYTDVEQAVTALEQYGEGNLTLKPADLEQATATLVQTIGALPENYGGLEKRIQDLCAKYGGHAIPTRTAPITAAMPFARLRIVLEGQQMRRLPAEKIKANPAAASFPGSVPADAPRETKSVTIDTSVPDWHGTGLYAAPGEVVAITIPATAVGKNLSVRIGSHTDTLWHLAKWERFPEVSMSKPLQSATTKVASPFGGAIFVVIPDRCRLNTIDVTIANAVAAPRYVLGQTTKEQWLALRNAPGPWAEMEGKLVILSVPSSAVRDLDDPEMLMTYWDTVMERCYELFAAPRRPRPERYCVDRQISAGYMHSGYPVMTGDDVAKIFCDEPKLHAKNAPVWGFYHEMGHNFQQDEWTWDGMGEVTNNLFSLYGSEKINGTMIGAHPAMTEEEMAKRVQTVAANPAGEKYYLRDPWYPLTMFWLLRKEFGWEPYTKVFAEFESLNRAARPRNDQQKRNQFALRYSKVVGKNIAPYLNMWGVGVDEPTRKELSTLPTWFPEGLKPNN